MNKPFKRIISVLLAAVFFAALLPSRSAFEFDIPKAKAAQTSNAAITKSNFKLDKQNKTATGDIGIFLPEAKTVFLAAASYDGLKGNKTELTSVSSVKKTLSKGYNSIELDLDYDALTKTGTDTLLFLWDDNNNPECQSALMRDADTLTKGGLVFEAEDIMTGIGDGFSKLASEYPHSDVSDNKLSGDDGLYSYKSAWNTVTYDTDGNITGTIIKGLPLKKTFYIEDYNKEKSYTLWIRARSLEAESGSIFYRLNSENETEYYTDLNTFNYSSKKDGTYRWSSKAIYPKSGENVIEFATRTSGIADKFIITDNSEFKPTDMYSAPEYLSLDAQKAAWTALWNSSEADIPIPPADKHPRLLFTEEKLSDMKTKWEAAVSADIGYTKGIYNSVTSSTGIGSDSYVTQYNFSFNRSQAALDKKHNEHICNLLMSRALNYKLGTSFANAAYLEKTISYALDYLKTVDYNLNTGDITRRIGDDIFMAAMIYDWLYDELGEANRQIITDEIMRLVSYKEIGWPPTKMSNVASHAGEQEIFRDLLAAGIAIYDEYPLLYQVTASRMYEEMLPARQFLRQSGRHEQGSDYGEWRVVNELWAELLINRMTDGKESWLDKEKDYPAYKNVLRTFIYSRMPYGSALAIGDNYANTQAPGEHEYYAGNMLAFQMGAYLFNDPVLKREFIRREQASAAELNTREKLFALLMDDGSLRMLDSDGLAQYGDERYAPVEGASLPLAMYSGYPVSGIFARTNWQEGVNAPTAMVSMDMHEVFVGDHQHKYTGDFQLYYKGLLAMNTGVYNENGRHNEGYNHRAISANTMLVKMDGEEFISGVGDYKIPNDGGQRSPITDTYNVREFSEFEVNSDGKATNKTLVVADDVKHFIGPDANTPRISYITGNLAPAYDERKIDSYTRSMVFVDRDAEDFPAAFIVYDRIVSDKAEYEKTWLLHSEQSPVVDAAAKTTTITRTDTPSYSVYNPDDPSQKISFGGKLVNKTLLPENVTIETIGDGTMTGAGSMFNYNGTSDSLTNYSVTNKTNANEAGRFRIEISPSGADIKRDNTFLNAMYVTDSTNTSALSMEKLSLDSFDGVLIGGKDTVLFNKTDELLDEGFTFTKTGTGFAFITGLKEGKWTVNGIEYTVTSDSQALYFEGNEGECNVRFGTSGTPFGGSFAPLTITKPSPNFVYLWVHTSNAPYGGYFVSPEYPIEKVNLDGTGIKTWYPIDIYKYTGYTVTKSGTSATITNGTYTATVTGLVERNGTLYDYTGNTTNVNILNTNLNHRLINDGYRKIFRINMK